MDENMELNQEMDLEAVETENEDEAKSFELDAGSATVLGLAAVGGAFCVTYAIKGVKWAWNKGKELKQKHAEKKAAKKAEDQKPDEAEKPAKTPAEDKAEK